MLGQGVKLRRTAAGVEVESAGVALQGAGVLGARMRVNAHRVLTVMSLDMVIAALASRGCLMSMPVVWTWS